MKEDPKVDDLNDETSIYKSTRRSSSPGQRCATSGVGLPPSEVGCCRLSTEETATGRRTNRSGGSRERHYQSKYTDELTRSLE